MIILVFIFTKNFHGMIKMSDGEQIQGQYLSISNLRNQIEELANFSDHFDWKVV